jgi:hypothetical protein
MQCALIDMKFSLNSRFGQDVTDLKLEGVWMYLITTNWLLYVFLIFVIIKTLFINLSKYALII